MPRGAHIDRIATKERRYMDKRSFVSTDGHEYLRGLDVSKRRNEVFERDEGMCQQCLGMGIPFSFEDWNNGQMHHKQGGLVGRCDCLHNLEWICRRHHQALHVRTQFGKHGPVKEIVA